MATMFLDANVFLYAIGGDNPHREACRAILSAAGRGTLEAVTDSEVLQEILHVRSRRVNVRDGAAAVRAAAAIVADVLPVTRADVPVACDLLERHPTLGARDAMHVAVMTNARLTLIVSVDRDFDCVETLKRLEPVHAIGVIG